ncbi:MAG: AAA domain-containing protein [Terriglobia bacterium]
MEVNQKRRDIVEKARQIWIKKLIDLSRRNNLLYYRPLKWGTFSLSFDGVDRLAALLRGDGVPLKTLVRGVSDEELMAKVLSIWRRSQANQEEKGLATMFVALGMAGWKAADGGRNPDSPVLLIPVALELKGRSGAAISVHRVGPVQVNLVLMHVLQEEYGLSISSDRLLPHLEGHDEEEVFDPLPLYKLVEATCKSIPDFAIKETAVLGNFAFQKMAMVRDLQENLDHLVSSDLVAALAGDMDAKELIGTKAVDPDPKEFDRIPPQSEFLILDADSSQQSAVAAVLQGQSAVVHGPPGTGKSQTIANAIASLTAAGKAVLFVAEKRAALEAVLKRLQQVGLDKLTVDLHGADVSSKRVMEQVAAALDAVRQSVPIACDEMHQRYVERRDRLNRHVANLHKPRTPGDLSVYELQGTLLHFQTQVRAETRWRKADLSKIETSGPAKVRDLLAEAEGLASLFLRRDPSPWNGVELRDGPAAQEAVDVAAELSSRICPEFMASLSEVVKMTGFRTPGSLNEARELYSLLDVVGRTLEHYSLELFGQDIPELMNALAAGSDGGVRAIWKWCTNGDYRRARARALACRSAGKSRTATLFTELRAAEDQRIRWSRLTGGSQPPNIPTGYSDARRKFELACGGLQRLARIVAKQQIDQMPLAELTAYIAGLATDRLTPMKLPKLFEIERNLEAAGVGNLVEEFRKGKIEPEKWALAFDQCWYSSCLEAAQADDPEVAGFSGKTHNGFVREFKQLDKERIRVAAARVQRAWAERAVAAMNEHRNEEYIIRAEAEKKRRHRPLRQLFAETRHVLTAVCPCWMASPLSVSQLLDSTRSFDFVVFDEASQVLPEDAIPAIMRGFLLVVAGDRWQLPPTTFFASADDDELAEDESTSGVEGYESLLDTTNAFLPSWQLIWHYRSRDEALISFSNHHIYKGRLVTFPGPGGPPVIQHVLIQQPLGVDGQEESCSAEVRKVVDLVLEHAQKNPHRSLGVIAMGIRHADRVQRAIDQALSERPELAEFFDPNAAERFFVKNLERVQGDERDSIILTVGYGKDRAGNLPFRFGPLLSFVGRRRLNVAITRARQEMIVVSSFSHLDMDLAKVKPDTGVEMLRDYLEYAGSGGNRLGGPTSTQFPMNSFEAEVFDVLTSKGIPVVSQVGASGYRIDLVAEHPEQPGRFVLAIECDGASYHSSPTARDRDRLRQQQLEKLGWKFHRIWSTDWFMRKDEEIQRATAAYKEAVAFADHTRSYFKTFRKTIMKQAI